MIGALLLLLGGLFSASWGASTLHSLKGARDPEARLPAFRAAHADRGHYGPGLMGRTIRVPRREIPALVGKGRPEHPQGMDGERIAAIRKLPFRPGIKRRPPPVAREENQVSNRDNPPSDCGCGCNGAGTCGGAA